MKPTNLTNTDNKIGVTPVVGSSASSDLNDTMPNPPKWLTAVLAHPREEGVVEVDGCDIHYFRWGDPSKPGIMMLHGFLAHARCFAFIAPYLTDHFHVVAMDLSGMGDSGWREEYNESVRVHELMQVSEQLGLFAHGKKPTIVAHSFGGRIATAAMHKHGERFAGMIICDLMIIRPSILLADAEKFKPPGNRDANRPNRVYPDFDAAKQRFVLSPPQSVETPILFDFMAYHSLKEVEGGWQWKFDPRVFNMPKATGAQVEDTKIEETWAKVGEDVVTAPGRKAIIYGQKSMLFTADSVAYMHELFQELGTEPIPLIDIPNARHHLMLDQPIAFVTALKSVLALWQCSAHD